MSFEPNKGQFNAQFKFMSEGPGYSLLLNSTRAALTFNESKTSKPATIIVKISGGNEHAPIHGAQSLPGLVNFFRGTSEHWITNIPTFETVVVDNVYPGIDAVYYGNQNHFEYDFRVKPGASARGIEVAFEGASGLTLTNDGDLVIAAGDQKVRQPKPTVFQENNGSRTYAITA